MSRATARALRVAARVSRGLILLATLVLLIAVPSQAGLATPAFDDESDGPWTDRLESLFRPAPSGPRSASETDVLRTISIDPSDRCPVYVGVAFDGRELLVSCLAHNVLTRVSPSDGRNLGSITIHGVRPSEGIAGMSWDAYRRRLWIGTANVTPQKIYSVELNSSSGAGYASLRFTRNGAKPIVDGVAYDGTDDTLWLSTDIGPTMYHYTLNGTLLGTFNVATSNGFGAAGVVVASRSNLYINNYFHTIEAINKSGGQRTPFIRLGNRRAEDMECDSVTFAPRHVVWGKVDFNSELHAWQVPECAQGGVVPGGGPRPEGNPPPPPSPASLTISPNPVPVGSSRTIISWNTGDGASGHVYVSENGGPESLVASGAAGSGVWPYVFPGITYDFRLYRETESQTLLRSVRVTRAPSTACEPRPRVAVTTVRVGSGLRATVTATEPGNRLLGLRFGAATNARISTDDRANVAGDFTFAPPGGSVTTTFSLQPIGPGAATAPITVFDDCGPWKTFVGAGAGR